MARMSLYPFIKAADVDALPVRAAAKTSNKTTFDFPGQTNSCLRILSVFSGVINGKNSWKEDFSPED